MEQPKNMGVSLSADEDDSQQDQPIAVVAVPRQENEEIDVVDEGNDRPEEQREGEGQPDGEEVPCEELLERAGRAKQDVQCRRG